MGKYLLAVVYFFGWTEISTFFLMIFAFQHRDYCPLNLVLLPPFIVVLGIFTLKLKRLALKLNLIFSPLIVLTYCSGFVVLIDYIASKFNAINFMLQEWHFWLLVILFLVLHIYFFNHPRVRQQFK